MYKYADIESQREKDTNKEKERRKNIYSKDSKDFQKER